MAADGYFLCCMGANIRDAMADLYRPFWATSIIAQLSSFDNTVSDMYQLWQKCKCRVDLRSAVTKSHEIQNGENWTHREASAPSDADADELREA